MEEINSSADVKEQSNTKSAYEFSLWARCRAGMSDIPWLRDLYYIAMLIFKRSFCQNGMATIRNCAFRKEQVFKDAYNAALKHHRIEDFHWRAYVCGWSARHALLVPGDFVECGVHCGFLSRFVIEYIGFENCDRIFYLFDTFSGPDPSQLTAKDEAAKRNFYGDSYEFVKNAFADVTHVRLRANAPS